MSPKSEPYFVTIVSSEISDHDREGYEAHRKELSEVVAKQSGFIGAEVSENGQKSISLTYWKSQEAMNAWAASAEHQEIKQKSHAGGWIQSVRIEIAQVNHKMEFPPKH